MHRVFGNIGVMTLAVVQADIGIIQYVLHTEGALNSVAWNNDAGDLETWDQSTVVI